MIDTMFCIGGAYGMPMIQASTDACSICGANETIGTSGPFKFCQYCLKIATGTVSMRTVNVCMQLNMLQVRLQARRRRMYSLCVCMCMIGIAEIVDGVDGDPCAICRCSHARLVRYQLHGLCHDEAICAECIKTVKQSVHVERAHGIIIVLALSDATLADIRARILHIYGLLALE